MNTYDNNNNQDVDVIIKASFTRESDNKDMTIEFRINEGLIPWHVNRELTKHYGKIRNLKFRFLREA